MTAALTQTMAEKILSRRSGQTVRAGDLAVVEVDQVMVVDSIAQSVIKVLADLEATPKFPERVSFVIDHVAPASTVNVAQAHRDAREYAAAHGCLLFDVGRGICHQVLMEEGVARFQKEAPRHHMAPEEAAVLSLLEGAKS